MPLYDDVEWDMVGFKSPGPDNDDARIGVE